MTVTFSQPPASILQGTGDQTAAFTDRLNTTTGPLLLPSPLECDGTVAITTAGTNLTFAPNANLWTQKVAANNRNRSHLQVQANNVQLHSPKIVGPRVGQFPVYVASVEGQAGINIAGGVTGLTIDDVDLNTGEENNGNPIMFYGVQGDAIYGADGRLGSGPVTFTVSGRVQAGGMGRHFCSVSDGQNISFNLRGAIQYMGRGFVDWEPLTSGSFQGNVNGLTLDGNGDLYVFGIPLVGEASDGTGQVDNITLRNILVGQPFPINCIPPAGTRRSNWTVENVVITNKGWEWSGPAPIFNICDVDGLTITGCQMPSNFGPAGNRPAPTDATLTAYYESTSASDTAVSLSGNDWT